MIASHGPSIQLSAAFPRTRVAGPGAPIAAAAPAVTERILVQVAATSSATMITSLCVPLVKQKNRCSLEQRQQPPETGHSHVFPRSF